MWFDVSRMPLGGFMWTLIALAAITVFGIIGASGWLLTIFIIQHVRIV